MKMLNAFLVVSLHALFFILLGGQKNQIFVDTNSLLAIVLAVIVLVILIYHQYLITYTKGFLKKLLLTIFVPISAFLLSLILVGAFLIVLDMLGQTDILQIKSYLTNNLFVVTAFIYTLYIYFISDLICSKRDKNKKILPDSVKEVIE